MKKILIAFCVLLVAALGASAQLVYPISFTTTTPFVVSDATLPAGTYTMSMSSIDEGIVEIQAASGKPSLLASFEVTEANTPAAKTEVGFKNYGGTMILKTVTLGGQKEGMLFISGHHEKKFKKAGTKATAATVAATKK